MWRGTRFFKILDSDVHSRAESRKKVKLFRGNLCYVAVRQFENFNCNYWRQAIKYLLTERACLGKSNIVFAEPQFEPAELCWQWFSGKLLVFEIWKTNLLERWNLVYFYVLFVRVMFRFERYQCLCSSWKCNTLFAVKAIFVQLFGLQALTDSASVVNLRQTWNRMTMLTVLHNVAIRLSGKSLWFHYQKWSCFNLNLWSYCFSACQSSV